MKIRNKLMHIKYTHQGTRSVAVFSFNLKLDSEISNVKAAKSKKLLHYVIAFGDPRHLCILNK